MLGSRHAGRVGRAARLRQRRLLRQLVEAGRIRGALLSFCLAEAARSGSASAFLSTPDRPVRSSIARSNCKRRHCRRQHCASAPRHLRERSGLSSYVGSECRCCHHDGNRRDRGAKFVKRLVIIWLSSRTLALLPILVSVWADEP